MQTVFTIKEETSNEKYAKFIISPLVAGYGHTLGIALRRVALSSIPGAAITKVTIEGAKHQFSTIKGVKEDTLDFLLNLKKVRFSYAGEKPVTVSLSATKAGEVKAGDIKTPSGVKIANPELVLANLAKGGKIEAEMEVESGVGYKGVEDTEGTTVGTIALDANFSPVERVNYKVEETRVGRVTNYDKLIFEIWTDGTLSPKEALEKSATVLSTYLENIINPQVEVVSEVKTEESSLPQAVAKLSVEEISLPTRVANALSKAGYDTVEKLVNADKNELVKIRNLGEKSLNTIADALKEKGVEF